jgi:hypothetical protein
MVTKIEESASITALLKVAPRRPSRVTKYRWTLWDEIEAHRDVNSRSTPQGESL